MFWGLEETLIESYFKTGAESSSELFWSRVLHRSSVCKLFTFIFHRLLQNHWTNFNQTWNKASLDEARGFKFVQLNKQTRPFPMGENKQNSENTLKKFKNLIPQNYIIMYNKPITTQHGAKHSWAKEIQFGFYK